MDFELWGIWHILYMLSPVIVMVPLYFIMRKRSQKTKYIVGVVIGVISLGILVARNIDIAVRVGFDPEIIPLQVCHFGNIMVFISLIFKSKTATIILWCLNLPAAFSSLVLADSLVNYSTLWAIRPQAYIWGHLFIVVGALYAMFFNGQRYKLKNFFIAIGTVIVIMIPAIILNSYFNDVMGYTINYFYIYNSNGVPFEFLYNIVPMAQYGWFRINWVYTAILFVAGVAIMLGLFYLLKFLTRKSTDSYYPFKRKTKVA